MDPRVYLHILVSNSTAFRISHSRFRLLFFEATTRTSNRTEDSLNGTDLSIISIRSAIFSEPSSTDYAVFEYDQHTSLASARTTSSLLNLGRIPSITTLTSMHHVESTSIRSGRRSYDRFHKTFLSFSSRDPAPKIYNILRAQPVNLTLLEYDLHLTSRVLNLDTCSKQKHM